MRQGACDFVVRFGPAPDFDRLIPLQDHVVAENSWYLQLRECRIAAKNQSENGQGDLLQHVGLAVGKGLAGFCIAETVSGECAL